MYRETLIKIIYDALKDFQGGRVTDDSKVSEQFVEDKVHDHRNRAIYRYYTSQKVRKKEFDSNWLQDFTAEYKEGDQPNDPSCPYTVFKIPKVLDLPNNAGMPYIGGGDGIDHIPVLENFVKLNNSLAHRDTKYKPMALNLGNELRVFNLHRPDQVYVPAIFERPPEVRIFGKDLSREVEELEIDKFRREEYYPISGTLLSELKQRLKKDLQLVFQTPVDRFIDDRHTTDYGAQQQEES